ncbi:TPA: ParB N-terminal domain-containing protein, partial [Escherichia coli]|nr:ParB N-terminal domain-containing protein [Escherichia coli]
NLRPNTWNTNSVGAQNFEKLKGSIEKLGFFKPILARELEDGFFEILGGEHRWRAAIEQGISTVPVLSVGKISDVVAKQMSLVDNERYGEDDQIALQRFIEEIQSELDYQLSEIAPYDDEISMVLAKEAAIDLEALEALSRGKVWAADEFGAVLDRVTAQVVASNLQRAARKVGATVMVATTHEDLKNALRPDMQITKHYKERVKVEYHNGSHDEVHL